MPSAELLSTLNRDLDDHAARVRRAFAQLATEGTLVDIGFRFTERIAAGGNAIERAVYRVAMTPPGAEPRLHFAEFPYHGRRTRRHLADHPRSRSQRHWLRRRAPLHHRARAR